MKYRIFCRDENYSKHNTSYWQGKPYLGIGPGAHSYNGTTRSYNVSNNSSYVQKIAQNQLASEFESLGRSEKINDYILTRLRTKWGVDLDYLKDEFDYQISDKVQYFIQDGLIRKESNTLVLTSRGKLLADYLASELFC